MSDTYRNFEDVLRHHPDPRFRVVAVPQSSPVLIAAPHGGGIEFQTDVIARHVARKGSFSLYQLVWMGKQARDAHITSHRFFEKDLDLLLKRHHWTVTIHGFRSERPCVEIGGMNEKFKCALYEAMLEHDISAIFSKNIREGAHPKNICNRGLGINGGVQLEFSSAIRSIFLDNYDEQCRAVRSICSGISRFAGDF
ncbi:MAG: poly-gamma-glutamate hydrolase family protein [Sumerlaeia bacterium]